MRFLDGIPATRKEELLKQLRAIWTHDSTAIEGNAYVRAHMGITSIHPFYDGNVRIARLVANLPVLVAGFPPIVIPMERRQDYIDSIRASEEDGDTEPFRELVRQSWQTTVDLVRDARAWSRR